MRSITHTLLVLFISLFTFGTGTVFGVLLERQHNAPIQQKSKYSEETPVLQAAAPVSVAAKN
jgi:hypothetical protein